MKTTLSCSSLPSFDDATLIKSRITNKHESKDRCTLSRREKRREKSSPMPAASAGLLRFFEEETQGIKIRPEIVVVLAVSLIVAAIIGRIFFAV